MSSLLGGKVSLSSSSPVSFTTTTTTTTTAATTTATATTTITMTTTIIIIIAIIKVEIVPIKISDILECVPGSEIFNNDNDHSDDAMFMTLVARNMSDPRILAILFETREERNMTLLGLRDVLAHSSQQRTPTMKGLRSLETEDAVATHNPPPSSSSSMRRPSRRLSVREAVIEEVMSTPMASGTWRENLTPAAGITISLLLLLLLSIFLL